MNSDINKGTARNLPARSILAVFSRGLIFAALSVVAFAVLAAIWGAIFGYHPSATIFGSASPGVEGAASNAMFYGVFAGPPIAVVAFLVGVVWAILTPPRKSGQ
jgi:hypothetical protein